MLINRRKILAGGSVAAAMTALGGCRTFEAPSTKADLTKLDGIAQAGLIKDGHMSATEAVEAALERIAALNLKLNAFTDVHPELALATAKKMMGASPDQPYAGLPYALKDLNEYPGMKYERGSAMFKGAVGKKRTPYTEKIDASGVIVLGKTATPEFGLLATTEPVAYQPCRNPWNLDHSAGGSSGGSSAAVAARILPMAQAGDGGGSIRNPASQCGIVGLKPSRGRFPDQGNAVRGIEITIKHCVSLSVRDTAMMLALTEKTDGSIAPVGIVSPGNVAPKRIAVTTKDLLGRMPHADVAKAVDEAAKQLAALGHEIILVDGGPGLPGEFADDFIVLWGQSVVPIVQAAEKMSGKSARDSGLLEGWTIDLAENYLSLSEQSTATSLQRLSDGGALINRWIGGFDAWLTPSAAMPSPPLGWTRGDLPFAQNIERSGRLVAHFSLHNIAGTPAINVPWSRSGGLPIGIQISSSMGGERTLLDLAYQIEEARPWMQDLPPVVAG